MPGDAEFSHLTPSPAELTALRATVGWDPASADYPAAFAGYHTTVSARSRDGDLVGFAAVVSDGVRHGFLIDVIVRPSHQRRGVGCELVARAVEQTRAAGVTIFHVDFAPENRAFYEACGFLPSEAGILE